MKQTSSLTQNLAQAQEKHAERTRATAPAFNTFKRVYRLYTETVAWVDVKALVKRYFDGASIFFGVGLDARTQQRDELATMIEIVSSLPDALQRAVNLAGDLRQAGNQISVLLTVQDVRTFEITAERAAEVPAVPFAELDSPTINLKSKAQAHRLATAADSRI